MRAKIQFDWRTLPPEAEADLPSSAAEERVRTASEWEQRVQFEALRGGNRTRQNDVLRDEIRKG